MESNVNPIYTSVWSVLRECWDFTWRVSDCEELRGGLYSHWIMVIVFDVMRSVEIVNSILQINFLDEFIWNY